jgi:hypothetical protein
MAIYFPVADQKDGSYLTITSDSGIQFMFIFFLSGLSQMLVRGFPFLPLPWQDLVLVVAVDAKFFLWPFMSP